MKHPSEFFIKYLIVKEDGITDEGVLKILKDWSILPPLQAEQQGYFAWLRQDLEQGVPEDFDPTNQLHRPSVQYLRKHGLYEMFFQTDAVAEAWEIISNPQMRFTVDAVLLSRFQPHVLKEVLHKINRRGGWHLTVDGVTAYGKFFWNVGLLTFDDWGRYLYGRTALYDRHLSMLQAPKELAFFHLRLEQVIESKRMIQRAQEIAYWTLEEIAQVPGCGSDKVKGISVLTKSINECHESLSTSDMALKEVLAQFERFRMENPQVPPPSIHKLAPKGNYSGSGVEIPENEDEKVH